jgi:hypothetical protein
MSDEPDDPRWAYFAGVLANIMSDIHLLQKVAAYLTAEKMRASPDPEGVLRAISEAVSADLDRTSTGAMGDMLAHSVELVQTKLDEFITVTRRYASEG